VKGERKSKRQREREKKVLIIIEGYSVGMEIFTSSWTRVFGMHTETERDQWIEDIEKSVKVLAELHPLHNGMNTRIQQTDHIVDGRRDKWSRKNKYKFLFISSKITSHEGPPRNTKDERWRAHQSFRACMIPLLLCSIFHLIIPYE
jgi:hypothetical protein